MTVRAPAPRPASAAWRRPSRARSRGVTLLELLIVLSIMAIVAAIAILVRRFPLSTVLPGVAAAALAAYTIVAAAIVSVAVSDMDERVALAGLLAHVPPAAVTGAEDALRGEVIDYVFRQYADLSPRARRAALDLAVEAARIDRGLLRGIPSRSIRWPLGLA